MPSLEVTTVDGKKITVTDSDSLAVEIARFDTELKKLLPDLEGSDDAAGERAQKRYDVLASQVNAIVRNLPAWNEAIEDYNRRQRLTIARLIRERSNG